jgi:hypothetical protein
MTVMVTKRIPAQANDFRNGLSVFMLSGLSVRLWHAGLLTAVWRLERRRGLASSRLAGRSHLGKVIEDHKYGSNYYGQTDERREDFHHDFWGRGFRPAGLSFVTESSRSAVSQGTKTFEETSENMKALEHEY